MTPERRNEIRNWARERLGMREWVEEKRVRPVGELEAARMIEELLDLAAELEGELQRLRREVDRLRR